MSGTIGMKYFVFLFLALHSPALWGQIVYEGFVFHKHSIVFDMRSNHNMTDWEFFNSAVFGLPECIQEVKTSNIPLFIIVPEALDGLGPLDKKAPFIEGIRTLLTWARVFYLFDNVHKWPLNIIFTENNAVDLPLGVILENISEVDCRTFEDINETVFRFNTIVNRKAEEDQFLPLTSVDATDSIKKKIRLPWHNKGLNQKRFCIAGGAGFIGSHLVKKLLAQGHQVIVLDNLFCSTLDNLKNIADPNLYFIEQDASGAFTIEGALDYIIHLASVPSPADYYILPKQTLASGLKATKNLLNLARAKDATFLFASTSEVYGDPLVHPQTEEYPGNVHYLGPRSQYDQSKRGAETLIKLYFEKYKIDVRIARIFNTYGPGMRLNDGRVITNFIGGLLEDRPLKIHGDGTQTRSFGYVDDTVQGLYDLATIPFAADETIQDRVFNIGTPGEFTIAELALKVENLGIRYLKKRPTIISIRNPDHTDPLLRKPDIGKAQKRFGFNPRITLEEGLEKTFLFFWAQTQPRSQ